VGKKERGEGEGGGRSLSCLERNLKEGRRSLRDLLSMKGKKDEEAQFLLSDAVTCTDAVSISRGGKEERKSTPSYLSPGGRKAAGPSSSIT